MVLAGERLSGVCIICGKRKPFRPLTEHLRASSHCTHGQGTNRLRQLAGMLRHELGLSMDGRLSLADSIALYNTKIGGELHELLRGPRAMNVLRPAATRWPATMRSPHGRREDLPSPPNAPPRRSDPVHGRHPGVDHLRGWQCWCGSMRADSEPTFGACPRWKSGSRAGCRRVRGQRTTSQP